MMVRSSLKTGVAGLALLAPSIAFAQASPGGATQPAGTGGEIIVTALKRADTVLKVPVAISVVSGKDLTTAGVTSVSDLQNIAVGVTVGRDAFGVNIGIRGVTTTDTTPKGEQDIAYNVDGAFQGRPEEQGLAFFDIDRVEVLRGPQGTIYGTSSTGGAINVITNKPVLGRLTASGQAEFGNFSTRRGEAMINLPLGDTLAFRAAGAFNRRDGYIRPTSQTVSDFDGTSTYTHDLSASGQPASSDEDNWSGRFALLYKPNSALHGRVTLTVGHIGGVGAGYANLETLASGADTTKKLEVYPNPFSPRVDNHFANLDGEIGADLGSISATYVGSYQHYAARENRGVNNNPFAYYEGPGAAFALPFNPPLDAFYNTDFYQGRFKSVEQELRFANANPGPFDYVVGANYYFEQVEVHDHQWIAPVETADDTSQYQSTIQPIAFNHRITWGLFGQGTFHVTPKLGLVGGLRYSYHKLDNVGSFAAGPFNLDGSTCTYPNDCTGFPDDPPVEKDRKLTWRAGLNYQASPRDLFYASVATGFKGGGYNDLDPNSFQPSLYGPESLTAYELGYKGRPASGLTLSTSAYYYDFSKEQINGFVSIFGNPVYYTRIAPTEIYGLEAEGALRLGPDTSLNFTGAYEHSKYKDFFAGANQDVDWSGLALDKTPKWVGTLALNHAIPLANDAHLRLRFFSKISSSYVVSDFFNALRIRQPGYTRSDASIAYAARGERYKVELFVQNIENKVQRTGLPTGLVPGIVNSEYLTVSPPRFYGVRLGFTY